MGKSRLPFKVGQLTESRSFVPGFRSSWFRCKINFADEMEDFSGILTNSLIRNISVRHKEVMHALEYLDFPDEKIRWTKLYQKPVGGSRSKEMKRQIMVRPSFPPIFCESQMPDVNNITEVVVIVNDVWKVGDLVDWWTDNCYWTGRLTEILGDGKARIELLPPPVDTLYSNVDTMYLTLYSNVDTMYLFSLLVGNGYLLKEKESSYCARIIKPLNPVNQEGSQNLMVPPVEMTENAQPTAGPSPECNASFSSRMSTSSLPSLDKSERHAKRPLSPAASKEMHALETKMGFDAVDSGIGKSSYSDSVSSSQIRDAATEMPDTDAGNKSCENSGSSKKMRYDRSIPLNSSFSDTIEAAILDYEELVNRVKWIKAILQSGTIPSNTVRPTWKFLEHRSSKKKVSLLK
ncbi:Agenet domain-containing protein [Citrus sinensis]|uniref:Agenet domain-containing protein n=1 Tax=Citrus sinensis TaxID=2711 RepID=A0ACB8I534_CITSI|nr:Agenet domain-containing protein [Citrus sinensis]